MRIILWSVLLKKKKVTVPENYIKNHIKLFVNSIIEDPSFESQSKDRLITAPKNFGSSPVISSKFIKNIINNLNIIDKVISFVEFKQDQLSSRNNGKKVKRIKDIPKLDDANLAGGPESINCTLILTEGDSAKTMAISGLKEIGRNNYGIFPLRGKFLNVKEASKNQLNNNSELNNLIKIIGLEYNKVYTNTSKLRYGKIMIMTDQDHDGSHIKGLIINLFHTLWPSLLQLGYITSMITPIIKVFNLNKSIAFYNISEYTKWLDSNSNHKKWKSKYYKGLGTSTSIEAIDYFKNMKLMNYSWTDNSTSYVDLAFKKELSNDRKQWLYNYDSSEIINPDQRDVTIDDFVNKEHIHFSNSDTSRSICSVID